MIYVNKKLKYMFNLLAIVSAEDSSLKLGKYIYRCEHSEDVSDIPETDWEVIHKNGNSRDFRSENLELVIFKDDEFFAEALAHIIENQIAIKRHLGIARDYDDCYWDREAIDNLRTIK